MIREFEGQSEKEAIDQAMIEFDLSEGEFDVEIIEESKKGIFKKGSVKIRVHVDDSVAHDHSPPRRDVRDARTKGTSARSSAEDVNGNVFGAPIDRFGNGGKAAGAVAGIPLESTETETKLTEFVAGVVERMGYSAQVSIVNREDGKILLDIDSGNSAILIGRKGKNLDALQLLTNVYSGRLIGGPKVVLDTENYRARREELLRKMAIKSADVVRRSGGSELLEPMNPFERRLIHTTLNDMEDVTTESEGEGLYRQVRVISQG